MDILQAVLLLILIAVALAAVLTRNLLSSVLYLSIFSFVMALLYLLLAAPDVAITETAIGAGISTLLLLAALTLTGEEEKRITFSPLPLIIVLFTGTVLCMATLELPRFGDPESPASTHVAPYYTESTEKDIGIPNVVTAVLASHRGYDTLGETYVIFTAGLSVWLILGFRTGRKFKQS